MVLSGHAEALGYERGAGCVSDFDNVRHGRGTYLSKAVLRVLPQGGHAPRFLAVQVAVWESRADMSG